MQIEVAVLVSCANSADELCLRHFFRRVLLRAIMQKETEFRRLLIFQRLGCSAGLLQLRASPSLC